MAVPSIRWFFRNWAESDDPPGEKLQQAVRNNIIKARTGQNCCGNHGQPGC